MDDVQEEISAEELARQMRRMNDRIKRFNEAYAERPSAESRGDVDETARTLQMLRALRGAAGSREHSPTRGASPTRTLKRSRSIRFDDPSDDEEEGAISLTPNATTVHEQRAGYELWGEYTKGQLWNKAAKLHAQLQCSERELMHERERRAFLEFRVQDRDHRLQDESIKRERLQAEAHRMRAELTKYKQLYRKEAKARAELEEQSESKTLPEHKAAVVCQSVYRSTRNRKRFRKLVHDFMASKVASKLKRRNAILRELLHTEQTYVAQLEVLREHFLLPLRKLAQGGRRHALLSEGDINSAFSNVEMILEVNRTLLRDLQTRFEEWPTVHIGLVLKRIVPFFKVYTIYINNYENAQATITHGLRKRKFERWLREREADPATGGLSLNSFLITPVQRIPRYRLLVEDLIKHTPEIHRDYVDLVEALGAIKRAATEVNEQKREAENLRLLRDIRKRLTGYAQELMTPSRRFLREGHLQTLELGRRRTSFAFLFTDLLLITDEQRGGKRYAFRQQLSLVHCVITAVNSRTLRLQRAVGDQEQLLLVFENAIECQSWNDSIDKALRNLSGAATPARRSMWA